MPFDYAEYQAKTSTMTTEQLQKEWENYTRQIAGGATSTATSVLFSPLTAGISLMGLGLSAPRIHNARKKREIIEKGLQERGTTHNTRGRDVAGSMALSGAISVATLGLAGPLADAAAGEAVGKGAEYAVAHLALDGVGEAVEHKHGGHSKKKAEQDLKMKAMQAQLAQANGGQQQMMTNGQMVNVNGQMVYQPGPVMGGFQPPGFPTNMALPQPGVLMQNQQQIQWQQQNPSMLLPGQQQSQMQYGGLQPGIVPPPRPHSAAPDNQYRQYAPIQHTQPQYAQQPPQYQQVQDSKFILNVVPDHQQPQMTPNGYPNEKSAAYTSEMASGTMTPLPLYSQQVPGQEGGHPSHIDLPPAISMEEEISLLKAKLLQMELEKRGMGATISGPLEISLDPPKPKEAEQQPDQQVKLAVTEISATTEVSIQPQQDNVQAKHVEHPQSHVETHAEAKTQVISVAPQATNTPALSTAAIGSPVSQANAVSNTVAPPAQAPALQTYTPAPPPPSQQQYKQQPQQQQQTPLYQPQPINPSLQAQQFPPPPPPPVQQTPQPQYAHIQMTSPQVQTPQPQYAYNGQSNQFQNATCPPGQVQRQDSGYYSQATTPMSRPVSSISSISSISSPQNRHGSISAYNPHVQQAGGAHYPQIHGRSGSVASVSSLPPPPYFPPPPSAQQPLLAGKTPDYFNQAPQIQPQMQPYTPQMGVQYGQVQQGWGQGQMMMGQPNMMMGQQQMVQGGGEPNYGPPPAIPRRM